MTNASQEQLLARAKATSHDLWRSFRLPDNMVVTAVGPCDYKAIDGGYRATREITYLTTPGGKSQKGAFVVDDKGMHHSNDRYLVAANGQVIRQNFDMPRAMHRLNSGMSPFDRSTSLVEKAVHLGYWVKNSYPFDAWYQADMKPPVAMKRDGDVISATMPIKFFAAEQDVLPNLGTFELSFNEKTYEITRAQCLCADGTPYRAIRDTELNEVYAEAGLKNPNPSKSRRLRERVKHACEGRAESVWREFALPPGLDIVNAEREFEVKDSGVDFEFARKFQYSENGQVKRGTFWVRVGDSSATWKNHWLDARGQVMSEFYPDQSIAEFRMTNRLLADLPPETAEESAERLAIVAWKRMSFEDGVEAFATDPFTFREEDGRISAVRKIRFWVPNTDKFGPAYAAIPEIGVFRVEMNADTNAITSVECTSSDGSFEVGHLDLSEIEGLHKKAGVPIGQSVRPQRTPRM
ncbi:hypothetical protein [Rhizobium sp. BK176]|uniref:hypothetical protein n=1 Tax=Rhizobium sp. BK176 TaxID=2587071 RepID=UPI002166DBDA|nr:hypothetical protein [Rhizobium sp. BK176]MCS4089532.1 hypothetical protein [Rhizobium sp. BK176]